MPSTQQKGTKIKIYMGKIPCASSPPDANKTYQAKYVS
jgi:hypothetical protein